MCTSVDRAVDRLQELCSQLGPINRPGRPTESFASLLEKMIDRYLQRSKIRSLTVDQPVDRQKNFLLIFSNGYFSFCLFLGLFPTTLLGFLLMFSSLINSGTRGKPIKKFEQVFTSIQKDLIKF